MTDKIQETKHLVGKSELLGLLHRTLDRLNAEELVKVMSFLAQLLLEKEEADNE